MFYLRHSYTFTPSLLVIRVSEWLEKTVVKLRVKMLSLEYCGLKIQ